MLLALLRSRCFTCKQTKVRKLDRVVPYQDGRAYGDPETVSEEPRANAPAATEDRLLSVSGLKLVLSINVPGDITS